MAERRAVLTCILLVVVASGLDHQDEQESIYSASSVDQDHGVAKEDAIRTLLTEEDNNHADRARGHLIFSKLCKKYKLHHCYQRHAKLAKMYAEKAAKRKTKTVAKKKPTAKKTRPVKPLELAQAQYSIPNHKLSVERALARAAKKSSHVKKEIEGHVPSKIDTGGTCSWWGCNSSRGPTVCTKGKCLCKPGFAAHGGTCLQSKSWSLKSLLISDEMKAGVAEPDTAPCPGANYQMASQGARGLVTFGAHKGMIPCRVGTQAYHGSPLPLVKLKDLKQPKKVDTTKKRLPTWNVGKSSPKDRKGNPMLQNGASLKHNYRKDLYSLITYRQWRNQLTRIMANEFFYSIAVSNVAVGAKKLGNMFHTLGDTYSGSHVVRKNTNVWTMPSRRVRSKRACENLTVQVAMSMDVVNWLKHSAADRVNKGKLFNCLVYYSARAVKLWGEARQAVKAAGPSKRRVMSLLEEVKSAPEHHSRQLLGKKNRFIPKPVKKKIAKKAHPIVVAVNKYIDRMTKEVFCRALKFDNSAKLDEAVGGATADFSSATGFRMTNKQRPVMPVGLASEADANKFIKNWDKKIKELRKLTAKNSRNDDYLERNVPYGLSYPSRKTPDVCESPKQNHISLRDLEAVWTGKSPQPQYLQPDVN